MRCSPYVVCVAALLAAAGCGGGSEPAPPPDRAKGDIERFEIRGQAAVLITPDPPGDKVVVYTHGSGETADLAFRDPAKQPIFQALLRAGYALAASDAHGDNWGSPASERDTVELARALRGRGLRDVYVLALSMGGFNGLQLLEHGPVKAWAGIFPACDLRSVYDVGIYPGQIRRAYHLPAKGPIAAALRRRSPNAVRPPPGLPMRFWASPEDRVIPKRANTDVCAALARRAGARVQVTVTRGDHGDPSNYDADGVLKLFASADG
jgi:pimeloyl-ACP methyl ester carboxylesterase